MEQENIGFRFTGKGSEYFRIWIVNLFLSIVTLGIYSAWAKVRRTQYFYRNTWLNNANFDYHGNPIAILKGRCIAFALFFTYGVSFKISPIIGGFVLIFLVLIFPYLLLKSFRFRAINSSYRGVRFGFDGTVGQAYSTFFALPLFCVITLGLAIPFAHKEIKKFQHGQSRLGKTPFKFIATGGDFYGAYIKAWLVTMGVAMLIFGFLAVLILLVMGVTMAEINSNPNPFAGILVLLVVYSTALFSTAINVSIIQNMVWRHTEIGDDKFVSFIDWFDLFLVYLKNLIGIIFTLGLYKPFADIRLLQYRLKQIGLVTEEAKLESYVAAEQQQTAAFGDEAAEMFDIDIAL